MNAGDLASRSAYREMVRVARRFAQTEQEAEDLAQEAFLVAIEKAVLDWSSPERRPWLVGVMRKRAAFHARTASRRRRRESTVVDVVASQFQSWKWDGAFLDSLPPSLRAVAQLASADLCSNEIRWLLRLSPTALRTRLSALRRAVRAQTELPIAAAEPVGSPLGHKRSLLLSSVKRRQARAVATLDLDGHALFFQEVAHKKGGVGNPT